MVRSVGPLTFTHLKWSSFIHSLVYLSLLISAFALGKPDPATFILGLTHGVLWILMSLACIAAARLRVLPLHVAVAVAVLGGQRSRGPRPSRTDQPDRVAASPGKGSVRSART